MKGKNKVLHQTVYLNCDIVPYLTIFNSSVFPNLTIVSNRTFLNFDSFTNCRFSADYNVRSYQSTPINLIKDGFLDPMETISHTTFIKINYLAQTTSATL